jgi:hypothetical protein
VDRRCPTPLFITGGLNINKNSSWCLRPGLCRRPIWGPARTHANGEDARGPACGTRCARKWARRTGFPSLASQLPTRDVRFAKSNLSLPLVGWLAHELVQWSLATRDVRFAKSNLSLTLVGWLAHVSLRTGPAAQNQELRGIPRAGLFAGLVEDVSKGAGCLHTAVGWGREGERRDGVFACKKAAHPSSRKGKRDRAARAILRLPPAISGVCFFSRSWRGWARPIGCKRACQSFVPARASGTAKRGPSFGCHRLASALFGFFWCVFFRGLAWLEDAWIASRPACGRTARCAAAQKGPCGRPPCARVLAHDHRRNGGVVRDWQNRAGRNLAEDLNGHEGGWGLVFQSASAGWRCGESDCGHIFGYDQPQPSI